MPEHYDVLIEHTRIIDGTGQVGFPGSVAIRGERVVALGDVSGSADTVIDGTGLITCPGFVDPHTHADSTIIDAPQAENLVMQGITTFTGGNCGFSLAPIYQVLYLQDMMGLWGLDLEVDWRTFEDWLSKVEAVGISLNYVPLVGHNTIRRAVMGRDFRRQATADEVDRMRVMAREAMQSGAFGLSAGLDASWAGHFAAANELVEMAKVAQAYGGFFTPHTRHHQNQWPASDPAEFGYGIFHGPVGEIIVGRYHGLLEAVEIARAANQVRLHIAHLTPAYIIPQPHPGFLDEAAARATLVDIVDRARDEGLDVTYNAVGWSQTVGSRVPIMASFLSVNPLLPQWLWDQKPDEFGGRLEDPAFREQVKAVIYGGKFKFGMLHPLTDPYWFDCYRILECAKSSYAGRTLGEITRERQPEHIIQAVYDESLEALFDILAADPGATWALIKDKREHGSLATFFAHPAGMPCCDVQAYDGPPEGHALYGFGNAPIAFGLFPQYLRRFVKELGVLTWEEAIRKATSVPAREVLGLEQRGVLSEGAYADVVVLNPVTISESGDFLDPGRPPEGIEHVLINGTVVYRGKAHTGERPGKVLRRS